MKKVVLNSSGGGDDYGISINGIKEKDITLKISKEIKDILESKGVEVLMLRDGDETISYDDRINKLKSKYIDPNDVILISNTLNEGGESGIEVIYPLNKNNTLPAKISDNLEYFNNSKYYQQRWPTDTKKDYYYITRNTPGYETIIIRYGYLDNNHDEAIIKNNYLKMADAVADAIIDYLGVPTDDVYIVKKGDTLYSIARKFNLSVDELKKLNNLTNNNISIDQKLKIKANNPVLDNKNIYVVKSGDTLYSIARKFNLTVDELKKLNNKTSNLITIGEELILGNPKTYIVKKGDTLYSIAKNNNTTVAEIKELNNLKTDNLKIGENLLIP